MATSCETDQHPGLTELVSGIVQDAQVLMRQQLTLFQVEIKNDFRRTLAAVLSLVAGGIVLLVGLIITAMAAAFLLHEIWPALPVWGGFAIIAGALIVIGAVLVVLGKQKFAAFNPLPDQTVEGLKENLQWKTKR